MYILSGIASVFEFLSDPLFGHDVFSKSKQDLINLGLRHQVLFKKEVNAGSMYANNN